MAAVQKQGSGLRRGPGKRCSSDSLDSSSLRGIKGVTSGKQGRMFLSGIHMPSAPRQRFTETGAELRLAQLSKEHLNGNAGNSATLPLCRLCSALWCLQGQIGRTAGSPVQVRTLQQTLRLSVVSFGSLYTEDADNTFSFCFSLSGRSF